MNKEKLNKILNEASEAIAENYYMGKGDKEYLNEIFNDLESEILSAQQSVQADSASAAKRMEFALKQLLTNTNTSSHQREIIVAALKDGLAA